MALNISLMLLMCLSTLKQSGSSTLPPETPACPTATPTSPPTPPDCITDSGRQLEPGESWTENCQFCTCDWFNGLECYYADCLPPMCVDAVQNSVGCPCYVCPNGDNCKIPETGEVIISGYPVIRNGMKCSCPPQSYSLPGTWEEENYIASCVFVSTPPPTTTQKYRKKRDNCKIPETGEVIPSGEPVIRNGMECRCPPQSYKMPAKWEEENYIANCVSVSTLPQTPPPTTPSTIPPTTTQKKIKKSRKNKQSKKDRKIARRTKTT